MQQSFCSKYRFKSKDFLVSGFGDLGWDLGLWILIMKVGIDIVEVKRIRKLIRNKYFLKRVFTSREIEYCRNKKNRAQHFAVRFATKEAVWKALGHNGIALKDIGVSNLPDGKPEAVIRGKKKRNVDISLSHTNEYAVAVAIITKE